MSGRVRVRHAAAEHDDARRAALLGEAAAVRAALGFEEESGEVAAHAVGENAVLGRALGLPLVRCVAVPPVLFRSDGLGCGAVFVLTLPLKLIGARPRTTDFPANETMLVAVER